MTTVWLHYLSFISVTWVKLYYWVNPLIAGNGHIHLHLAPLQLTSFTTRDDPTKQTLPSCHHHCSRPGTHGLLLQFLHLFSCYVCYKAALLLTCLISTGPGWNHHLDWSQKLHASRAGGRFHLLVSFWADSCGLIILGTVNVRAVVKCPIPTADRSATALVDKVPMEASVGPVLSALVLHEERALLCAELLQVTADRKAKTGIQDRNYRITGAAGWRQYSVPRRVNARPAAPSPELNPACFHPVLKAAGCL